MSLCKEVHRWAAGLPRHTFPFDESEIPQNGINILFERGERAHGTSRIVRIGTHTGRNQLRSRLYQHFLMENKDRSIFRKNISRALLNKSHDPYADLWEIDLTTRAAKLRYGKKINLKKQAEIEKRITRYLQKNFSFAVVQINDKAERLALESKLISTISLCKECIPSKRWLGRYSPKDKIRESGLWLVNELYKTPLSKRDFAKLRGFC